MGRFTMSWALDPVFGENKGENTEQHSDTNVSFWGESPEDTFNETNGVVWWNCFFWKTQVQKWSKLQMELSTSLIWRAKQLLQMSLKWSLNHNVCPKETVLSHLCCCHYSHNCYDNLLRKTSNDDMSKTRMRNTRMLEWTDPAMRTLCNGSSISKIFQATM